MRAALLVVLLTGCSKASPPWQAPQVDDESALALATAKRPPRTVTIDATGKATGLPVSKTPESDRSNDPPPPDEEEAEDDGPSGSLTESIMLKPESDADIARRERGELRRATGVIGRRDDVVQRTPAGWPSRVSTVTGELLPERATERPAEYRATEYVIRARRAPEYLILAHPAAPATALVDAVHATEGAIGVTHRGKVRMLPLLFVAESNRTLNDTPALEVRVRAASLEVEAIPSVPTVLPWPTTGGDAEALEAAVATARAQRQVDPRIAIDVLVDGDVTAQRLVDVIVVLEGTGTAAIALGRIPPAGSPELAKRGRRITYARWGPVFPRGPLTKDVVQAPFKTNRTSLEQCNLPTPGKTSHDELVVIAKFTILPEGTVSELKVSAMTVKKRGRIEELVSDEHPDVEACVRPIVAAMTFPPADKPTEVELPFGLYD